MEPVLKLKSFEARDLTEAFAKYKLALADVVENSFGWNEKFQQERFRSRYELSWFYWIEVIQERIGYVCYWQREPELHVCLLIIDSDKRNLGYGRLVMEYLHEQARSKKCHVALSSFQKNQAAISFYQKIGYFISGGDEHFVEMIRSTP